MTIPKGMVLVSIAELKRMRDAAAAIQEDCDHAARIRADANMLVLRCDALMQSAVDPDVTPVRPPSSDALKAFENSSDFEAPERRRKPTPPPIPARSGHTSPMPFKIDLPPKKP